MCFVTKVSGLERSHINGRINCRPWICWIYLKFVDNCLYQADNKFMQITIIHMAISYDWSPHGFVALSTIYEIYYK